MTEEKKTEEEEGTRGGRLRVRRELMWGQGAGGAGRTCDRSIPGDLKANSLSIVPLTLQEKEEEKEKIVRKRKRMNR
ncbi:hypothetical protein PoB_003312100 [Plakobranchus ocellatus]|uniref:Uncharacterized protein n=1 Tax=Plakobranchus ocellatus TaxID=259542 RepID=A0AAV4AJ15_9GAST|nr:hypothetical protein PoB_003312100 [Plakobranchus ocellatus]